MRINCNKCLIDANEIDIGTKGHKRYIKELKIKRCDKINISNYDIDNFSFPEKIKKGEFKNCNIKFEENKLSKVSSLTFEDSNINSLHFYKNSLYHNTLTLNDTSVDEFNLPKIFKGDIWINGNKIKKEDTNEIDFDVHFRNIDLTFNSFNAQFNKIIYPNFYDEFLKSKLTLNEYLEKAFNLTKIDDKILMILLKTEPDNKNFALELKNAKFELNNTDLVELFEVLKEYKDRFKVINENLTNALEKYFKNVSNTTDLNANESHKIKYLYSLLEIDVFDKTLFKRFNISKEAENKFLSSEQFNNYLLSKLLL